MYIELKSDKNISFINIIINWRYDKTIFKESFRSTLIIFLKLYNFMEYLKNQLSLMKLTFSIYIFLSDLKFTDIQ
jgi:hypothetical protein